MMILVTGAAGFVGRRVVGSLAAKGRSVRALVHSVPRAEVLAPYDVDIAKGDILVPESLASACKGVEAVIHLVAVIREGRGMTLQRVNYQGTKNMLEAAEEAGVRRFIQASPIGAGSDPAIPYLYSCWMAEQEAERSPIPHTTLRFSVGYGEGDEFFNMMAAQVKLSPIVPIAGDGKTRFQPIAVEDMARCLISALERDDTIGRTIEAGGPAYLTYEQMIDLVAETLWVKITKVHVPLGLMRPVAAVMEALMPRPPVTPNQLKMLRLDNRTDLFSVETNFGFMPQSTTGNIGYISKIGLCDAVKINLGFMPRHIRDH